jgi:hypothetical protein
MNFALCMIGVICQFVSCGTVLLSSVETYNKRNELTRTDENRKWHQPRFEGIEEMVVLGSV